MNDSKTSSGGIGFTGLLTIAFIVLKLCKMIDWPWVWVVSPIWISITLVLLVLGGIGVYYFIQSYRQKILFEKRNKERQAEIDDLKQKGIELSDKIVNAAPTSKWQQRMNEMNRRQEATK